MLNLATHQHATDKLKKKSLNITRTPSNSTINPNLNNSNIDIITETSSDSKYRDHLAVKVAQNKLNRADKKSKSLWGVLEVQLANLGQPVGCFRDCQQPS